MIDTSCYTRDQLQLYLHGRADDDLSGAIEVHLESCPRCEDTLSELDDHDDTLIRTLKLRDNNQPETSIGWIEQVANLPYGAGKKVAEPRRSHSTKVPEELEDYELLSVLGRGGMSVVFAARHKHLGRDVALKVLLPANQQHTVSRERFAREMKAVGGLDHTAIVRATDAGECNEILYLAMEQINGVDLNRVSHFEGPLRVADACAIGVEVAHGLAYAHEQGVVHRDIKPSNLMLDASGNVKILDFGLARLQSAACDVSLQTTIGQLIGTLDYMAPEQASGADVDARADVYALGATLFKLLTGMPPHGRSAEIPIIEFLNCLATNEASRLDAHRDQLPVKLVDFVAKMLHRSPEQRVASAEFVSEQLKEFAVDADLSDLAARAAEKDKSSHKESVASVKESLAEVWSQPSISDDPPEHKESQKRSIGQASIGKLGWVAFTTSVATLVGLIALTIVLTLKSERGEIRIESELDNVRVEVVDEKDRAHVIAVNHGRAETTVRAGRYRIRLDSSSDGVQVTPQVLTVTKNSVVIARVTKIPAKSDADVAVKQHSDVATMEARIELEETLAELADAKKQPKSDPSAIKSLEEKIARLRAMSRLIPTEPVYQGRTLADWVAQMKFEQEEEARIAAAQSVLKLAKTRPGDERMTLILDACSRLFEWNGQSIDHWMKNPSLRASTVKLIDDLDPEVISSQLVGAFQDGNRRIREQALLFCAALRERLLIDETQNLLSALEILVKSQSGADKILTQLTLAHCNADDTEAANILSSIEVEAASDSRLEAIIVSAHARSLKIPHAKAVAWVAAYIDKLPSMDWLYAHSNHHTHLFSLTSLKIGPFREVNWDQPDEALQADIRVIVTPLLRSFEQHLKAVAENPRDEKRQIAAALKSGLLTRFIDQAGLTGKTKEKAVTLLTQRLEQLIWFRNNHLKRPNIGMDTPAEVAVAVLLLTGKVPDSIKNSQLSGSGYWAKEYGALDEALLLTDGWLATNSPSFTSVTTRSSKTFSLANWYPFEVLAVLCDVDYRLRNMERDSSKKGQGYSSVSTFLLSRWAWRTDSRLTMDYLINSESSNAAGFAYYLLEPVSHSIPLFVSNLRRHPQYAKLLMELMNSENQHAIQLGVLIANETQSREQLDSMLLSWLKTGDVVHRRAAMEVLIAIDRKRAIQADWPAIVAEAIDHIATKEPLKSRDMFFLIDPGDTAPNPVSHAVKFLKSWLENPEKREHFGNARWLGRSKSALSPCVNILRRNPRHAKQFEELLQKYLKDQSYSLDNAEISRLLQVISEQPDEAE